MEFSDEEKIWLATIASEVPDSDELTPREQFFCEMAKPKSVLEEWAFEFMACVKLGVDCDCQGPDVFKEYAREP